MNPVKALEKHGQSVWLDFLARGFVAKGDLKKLIDTDGVKGVTSNPSIFEKAIGSSNEYDGAIGEVLKRGDRPVAELFEHLAIEDIQNAAGVLRPVYDQLKGDDGFVSLEVSPYLAMDTKGTIAEAEHLWKAVDRKNLMVKVPATPEGLPAIEHLIGKGVSINITLLFSQKVYVRVAEAYLAGLEKYIAGGGDPSHVASVASFFVSRIDSAVDKELDEKIAKANDPTEKARLSALKGKIAIANAKMAYQDYKKLFSGPRWQKLEAKGAKPQRLLWASTGTKNKDYSDVLYVEELIGNNTINTVPPATLDAFRDHGKLRDSLEENIDDAKGVLAGLEKSGISLDAITAELVKDGVKLFADAADKLYGAVAHKRVAVIAGGIDQQKLALGASISKAVETGTEQWRASGRIRRLWQRDKSIWTGSDEDKWLGWLDSASAEKGKLADYRDFANWVKQQGFTDAVVLGMGGSSLGPEVIAETFGEQPGFPKLHVLDSTDPAQVRAMANAVNMAKTLFIVSSKSGGTTEPNVMKDFFLAEVSAAIGSGKAGRHFVAVTDPGSSLEKVAKAQGFARIFHGDPTIGGRYSVLSPFGLVPAAAAGVDLARFLDLTLAMVRSCGPDVPPHENPGVQLGLAMGIAGRDGRDKVTILSSKKVADFGAWGEQLIAESTGKDGKGLIPIDGEPLGEPTVYGSDRFFIDLRTEGEAGSDDKLAALETAGHPVVHITMKSVDHIGQEFFRFEIATAVAGAILGINPFNQPDVEAAKIKTRELTAAFEKSGSLPSEKPVISTNEVDLYTDDKNAGALRKAGADGDLGSWLKAHLGRAGAGDYVALLAYIERNAGHIDTLQHMRLAIADKRHVATCAEFGPRFLHSTGQAYKGGPDSGVFLQITADDAEDLAVPGQQASFGIIKAAQARGDFDVLTERGRRALRVHLKGNLESGLAMLDAAILNALN
jgi:transaldolase/glucose-6-phosphate isomerase